jgi:hypothetical protein
LFRVDVVIVSTGWSGHADAQQTKEVNTMNRLKSMILGATVTGSLLTGGVIGAALAGPLLASAATTSSNAATAAASPSATTGKFVPNEDPAHEAGESAEREAQENAGQVPTVP